jgi:FkbM family methyltransferase
MQRFVEGKVSLFDHKVEFSDQYGFLHSVEEIFKDEIYRFDTNTAQPLIIDAGANFGLSVIYFKRLHPDCRIIAFEPDPKIFRLLERNVQSQNFDGVELRNTAAWIADDVLSFFAEGSLAGSTVVNYTGAGHHVTVKAERLKLLLQEKEVEFLKLDIEGAENSVLPDIAPELKRVRALFFEYHSIAQKPQQLDGLLRIVSEAGFRYVIKSALAPRYPFLQTLSPFDLQLNIFCYRN